MAVTVIHNDDGLDNRNPGKQVLASVVASAALTDGRKVDFDDQVLLLDADAVGLTNLGLNTDVTARRVATALVASLIPTTVPLQNATGVAVGANLVLTYGAAVSKGVGNLELFNATTGATIATVAVGSATVGVSGAVVTYNPAADLPAASIVELRVDAGAFVLASDTTVNSKRVVLRFTTA